MLNPWPQAMKALDKINDWASQGPIRKKKKDTFELDNLSSVVF